MKRILIKISYDGTEYHGFQAQDGLRTIQGEVERALSELTGERIIVTGGSRTDAGVHSLGNIAVFDTESSIPADKFAKALNTRLPHDIVVWYSAGVESDFHPRKRNSIKTYEYTILNTPYPNPIYERYMHHVPRELDIAAMSEAAGHFLGKHDFTSFCSVNTYVEDKTRTVVLSEIAAGERIEGTVIFRVAADGFLYNMVRIMAGTLIQTGLGQFTPADIDRMLEGKNRGLSGSTAPAKGLCHMKTEYTDI